MTNEPKFPRVLRILKAIFRQQAASGERTRRGAALALLTLMSSAASGAEPAEVIFRNARFHTLDSKNPSAEEIAVVDGKIVAIGASGTTDSLVGSGTRVIDLAGGNAIPGLIDAHGHVAGLGSFGYGMLDLSAAKSLDEVVAAVAERAKTARKGEWILGGRWDHESWPDKRLPTHEGLSRVSPDNPVWLRRVDGHAGLANALAMKVAGITQASTNPPGGEILRDAAGAPSGVFIDNAMDVISVRAGGGARNTEELLLKAQEMCIAAGLTGVHDAGISPADVAIYQKLADSKRLKLRVYAMMSGEHARDWFAGHAPFRGDRFSLRACKLYMDGALGSRGAWLLAPYADRALGADSKPYFGLSLSTPEFVREIAADGLQRGYQVCTHAIGDRANREVLDAYAAAMTAARNASASTKADAKSGPTTLNDPRFRIEHAQILAPADIPRFAALGVIPSMQPTHCTSDMRWAQDRVGPERLRGAYAWADLLQSGARIAGGSDFPVESHDPLLGIYAAVSRQGIHGAPPGGWHPEQRVTREQALRMFTIDAAYAAFEEEQRGTLSPGKLADFVVFDRDLLSCDAADIPRAVVQMTVIGGEVVYRKP